MNISTLKKDFDNMQLPKNLDFNDFYDEEYNDITEKWEPRKEKKTEMIENIIHVAQQA